MRRKVKTHPISRIKTVKPMFWNECVVCGDEFRKEKMWMDKRDGHRFGEPCVYHTFICMNCAATEEEAINKFNGYFDEFGK